MVVVPSARLKTYGDRSFFIAYGTYLFIQAYQSLLSGPSAVNGSFFLDTVRFISL